MTAIDFDQAVPECSCDHNPDGRHLHRDDCVRLLALVEKYHPPGFVILDGRVIRPVTVLDERGGPA